MKNNQRMLSNQLLMWLGLSLFFIVLDQWVKWLVTNNFTYGEHFEITSFFNLLLTYNAGASFGMLKRAGGWQIYLFSIISILVSLLLIIWLNRTPRKFYFKAED